MKFLITVGLVTLLFSLTSCKNGSVRNVCVKTESREYEYCQNQNTSICEQWDTQCRVDSWGEEICSTKCVRYQQVERCETRYKEVCVAYEKRLYCKARKEWMTESDFYNNCPSEEKGLITKLLNTKQFDDKACIADTVRNETLIAEASIRTNLKSEDILTIVEKSEIDEREMESIKNLLKTDESKDVFSFIKQVAENNLDQTECKN